MAKFFLKLFLHIFMADIFKKFTFPRIQFDAVIFCILTPQNKNESGTTEWPTVEICKLYSCVWFVSLKN